MFSALTVSGLHMDSFIFVGFLGRKEGKRINKLKALKEEKRTLIIYEAPHRIKKVLREIKKVLGDRQIVVARELTKKFEEILRGKISEIEALFEEKEPRGEFTLVIKGKSR